MKLSAAIVLALVVNILLFSFMQAMVARKQSKSHWETRAQRVDFVQWDRGVKPLPKWERPRPPVKPKPKTVERLRQRVNPAPLNTKISHLPLPVPRLELDLPLALESAPDMGGLLVPVGREGPELTPASELTPIVQIPPQYPFHAKSKRIEGYVDVEFTVGKDGRVRDPKIIEAFPPRIFNRAVLRALRHWKFEPRLVEGRTEEVRAKQRIDFKLSG